MRKAYVVIKTRVIVELEDNVQLDDVITNMDYSFASPIEGAYIADTSLVEYELQDVK